jgi:hypothetical protein
MLRMNRTLAVAGAVAFGAAFAPALFDGAEASDRVIRRCSAQGAGDISMTAKFEDRGRREKFSIEMEAAPGGAFRAGQRIVFFVAGVNVGRDALERVVGGDLVGELNLDTNAGPNDPDEDPFPANFPPVGVGTKVRIKAGGEVVLGCSLR